MQASSKQAAEHIGLSASLAQDKKPAEPLHRSIKQLWTFNGSRQTSNSKLGEEKSSGPQTGTDNDIQKDTMFKINTYKLDCKVEGPLPKQFGKLQSADLPIARTCMHTYYTSLQRRRPLLRTHFHYGNREPTHTPTHCHTPAQPPYTHLYLTRSSNQGQHHHPTNTLKHGVLAYLWPSSAFANKQRMVNTALGTPGRVWREAGGRKILIETEEWSMTRAKEQDETNGLCKRAFQQEDQIDLSRCAKIWPSV